MNCPYCKSPGQSPGDFCAVCSAQLPGTTTVAVAPSAIDDDDEIGADELARMDLPPARHIVQDTIVRGLTVLAGRPKAGKSFWIYDVALAVASGQPWNGQAVDAGRVLFLAMEDTRARLKARLEAMTDAPPAALRLKTKFHAGGLLALEAWIVAHPDTRLVIIDTLQKLRSGKKSGYNRSYDDAAALKQLADKLAIAIVCLHHTTKKMHANPLDSIMGDSGLPAAADTVMVLQSNDAGQGALWFKGRDLPQTILPMTFANSRWALAGTRDKAITHVPDAPAVVPALPAPKPDTLPMEAPAAVLRGLETHKSEWTYGQLTNGQVLYLRCMAIGLEAARAALRAHGCVKIGLPLPFISEADLMSNFTKVGWTAKRLTSCETINDAVRAGYLVIGRPA